MCLKDKHDTFCPWSKQARALHFAVGQPILPEEIGVIAADAMVLVDVGVHVCLVHPKDAHSGLRIGDSGGQSNTFILRMCVCGVGNCPTAKYRVVAAEPGNSRT